MASSNFIVNILKKNLDNFFITSIPPGGNLSIAYWIPQFIYYLLVKAWQPENDYVLENDYVTNPYFLYYLLYLEQCIHNPSVWNHVISSFCYLLLQTLSCSFNNTVSYVMRSLFQNNNIEDFRILLVLSSSFLKKIANFYRRTMVYYSLHQVERLRVSNQICCAMRTHLQWSWSFEHKKTTEYMICTINSMVTN